MTYSKRLIILVSVAPLLMAAMWMDRQPSPKPYQAPVLVPPADSVPINGKELLNQGSQPINTTVPTPTSLERGKELFRINCAMCHGLTSVERGPVGKKLTPPPLGLDHDLLQNRSDSHIYKAISLGFGRMPPFKAKLTQQERWEVVNFLRTRK